MVMNRSLKYELLNLKKRIKPELYDPLVPLFFIKIEGRGHHGLTQLPILLRQVVPKKDIVHTQYGL